MMAAVSDILILHFAALHMAAFTGRNQEATIAAMAQRRWAQK
jgi:hypothetical protein